MLGDPFNLLGLDPSFELPRDVLERRHRELSQKLHPDRFVGRPGSERRQALSRAIEVNQAQRQLKDPITRAEALLRRLGVALGEGSEPRPEPAFLMEVMDWQEQLRAIKDACEPQALAAFGATVGEREKGVSERLGVDFRRVFALSSGLPERTQAQEQLGANVGKLRFYRRLLTEVEQLEDDWG